MTNDAPDQGTIVKPTLRGGPDIARRVRHYHRRDSTRCPQDERGAKSW